MRACAPRPHESAIAVPLVSALGGTRDRATSRFEKANSRNESVSGMMDHHSAFRSLLWPVLDAVSTVLLGVVSVLVLARLIGDEAFGLGAIALGVVLVPFVAVNSIVHDAIICQEDLRTEDIDSAFTGSLCFGLAALLATGALAVPIGQLLQEPRLPVLIWAFSPLLVLHALFTPILAVRRRQNDFTTVGRHQIVARLLGAFAGILSALNGANVWSLVAQQLTTGIYMAAAMFLVAPRCPRLNLGWSRLLPMIKFCLPIIVSQLLSQGTTRLFLVAMGYWHGLAAAGHWGVATRIAESLSVMATHALYNVALVHLSRLRGARELLAEALARAQGVFVITSLPLLAAFAAAADPLAVLLLGQNWAPTGNLLLGTVLGSFFVIRRMLPITTLNAIGRSRVSTTAAIADCATAGVGLLLFGALAPVAVAAVFALSTSAGYIVVVLAIAAELGRSVVRETVSLARDLFCGCLAVALGRAASILPADPSILKQTLYAAGAALVSAALMMVLTRQDAARYLVKSILAQRGHS